MHTTNAVLLLLLLLFIFFFIGPESATPSLLLTCESLAIRLYSEHVEMKEITVKSNEISLHRAISIILMASTMLEADYIGSFNNNIDSCFHMLPILLTGINQGFWSH